MVPYDDAPERIARSHVSNPGCPCDREERARRSRALGVEVRSVVGRLTIERVDIRAKPISKPLIEIYASGISNEPAEVLNCALLREIAETRINARIVDLPAHIETRVRIRGRRNELSNRIARHRPGRRQINTDQLVVVRRRCEIEFLEERL